jgi:hypothetical protein
LKCGKLLRVGEENENDPDGFEISENCNHFICNNCSKKSQCPICNTNITAIEDTDNLSDTERKEYLEKMIEKFLSIDSARFLTNIKCGKRHARSCVPICTRICMDCFNQNNHDGILKQDCDECINQFKTALFCHQCVSMHNKSHTDIINTEDILLEYSEILDENMKMLDENISTLDKDIHEIDSFIQECNSGSKRNALDLDIYSSIVHYYQDNSEKFIREQKKNEENQIKQIDEDIQCLDNLQSQINLLDQNLNKVEDMHNIKHNKTKFYEGNKADDLWNKKYKDLNDNVENIKTCLSKYRLKPKSFQPVDNVLPTNTYEKLIAFIEITTEKKEFRSEKYNELKLNFKNLDSQV